MGSLKSEKNESNLGLMQAEQLMPKIRQKNFEFVILEDIVVDVVKFRKYHPGSSYALEHHIG